MVALRKDVKVGLTIGAIVVAVVGVYAGLSALAGGKPAGSDSTASLQTTPPNSSGASNTSPSKGTTGIADRTPRTADKVGDAAKSPPALSAGSGTPAVANPDAPVAAGNRKPGDDPWQNAFASGHIEPAITVTPDPGKPAGGTAADRSDIIKSMTGAGPSPDPAKNTASTNEPSGAVAGGAGQPTLTKTNGAANGSGSAPGDQTHVIVPGETFSAISAQYYGDAKYVKLILDANPSVNPNKLKPGTPIRIPVLAKKEATSDTTGVPSTAAAAAAKIDPAKQYVIKPGDSLHKIASELYGDIAYADKLYAANKALIGADPAKLKVGTVLSLPEAPKKK